MIIADDVGLADVDETATPNIDTLAAGGVTFRNAFANSVCSPSRRALHFGLWWPDARGEFCRHPDELTPGAIPSLPELLRSRGYATAIFGKWHVGSAPAPREILHGPQYHGYDTWRAGLNTNVANPICSTVGTYESWTRVDDGVESHSREYVDAAIRDAFLDWWFEVKRPHMAVVSFQLGHQPFHNPPRELLPEGTPLATAQRAQFKQMVQALDTLVGQVLEVAGPEDIVILVGDNGTPGPAAPPGQSNRAKATSFERGIRVPLVVRAPSARRGAVSEALVHIADVFPTLAELTGRPVDTGEGISLAPLLRNPGLPGHEWILCGQHQRPSRVIPDPTIDHCIRTQRHKLRFLRLNGVESQEFYDLELDPDELAPIPLDSPEHVVEIERLRRIYASAWTPR